MTLSNYYDIVLDYNKYRLGKNQKGAPHLTNHRMLALLKKSQKGGP